MIGTYPIGAAPLGALPGVYLLMAAAIAQNRILVRFSGELAQSDPIDDADALNPENYELSVSGGSPPEIAFVKPGDTGSEVIVWTVCGFTGEKVYTLTVGGNLSVIEPKSDEFTGPIELERRDERRGDISVAVTPSDRAEGADLNLGTYDTDGRGDYALGSDKANLRKRMLRRLVTPKGSVPYAPDYGVGIERFQARKMKDDLFLTLSVEIEKQMIEEPEVTAVASSFTPVGHGLLVKIKARTSAGEVDIEKYFDWYE